MPAERNVMTTVHRPFAGPRGPFAFVVALLAVATELLPSPRPRKSPRLLRDLCSPRELEQCVGGNVDLLPATEGRRAEADGLRSGTEV
jgi:hypothetical protein